MFQKLSMLQANQIWKKRLVMQIKIPDTSGHAKKTDLNAKVSEIENKIASITDFSITTALTAVKNKISDVINLVKQTDYNTKISEIESKVTNHDHDKYTTISERNNLIKI